MADNSEEKERKPNEFEDLGYVKRLGYYHLGKVSRTFALTIPILRLFKGEHEYDKSDSTMLFYLIPRGMDAIEDSRLSHEKKIKYMSEYMSYLTRDRHRVADKWREFTDEMLNEKNPENSNESAILNPDEADMLKDFALLWKGFYRLKPDHLKSTVVPWLEDMALGMLEYDHPDKLTTIGSLDDYCLSVAGTVGRLLTEVVYQNDKQPETNKPVYLSRDAAQRFALFLQYINVCRDIGDDQRKLGKVWVPKELYPNLSSKEFIESNDSGVRVTRLNALEELLKKANEHREDSFEYIKSIPDSISGYRAFCLLNWLMASETLKEMRKDTLALDRDGRIESHTLDPWERKLIEELNEPLTEKKRNRGEVYFTDWLRQRGIQHLYRVNEDVFDREGGVKIGSIASYERLKKQIENADENDPRLDLLGSRLRETEKEIIFGIPLLENIIHHVCYSGKCTDEWIANYSANPYRVSFSKDGYPLDEKGMSQVKDLYSKIGVLFPEEKPKRKKSE